MVLFSSYSPLALHFLPPVLEHLANRGERVSCAESCTGGGVCRILTSVPGASRVVTGGVVAYDTAVKSRILGVDEAILTRSGVVSPETAMAMALGVQRLLCTEWGIATTGYAGPGGGDERFGTGNVCFAIASPRNAVYRAWHRAFHGPREDVMQAAALHLIEQWADCAL